MSPASSGALEVERYIGACLITSQARSKGGTVKSLVQDQYFKQDFLPRYISNNTNHHYPLQRCRSADVWAGGMPLISFNNYQRRSNKVIQDGKPLEYNNPLSRLVVHTQGAPLILTNKYHRKIKGGGRDFGHSKPSNNTLKDSQVTDTVSVNSDESCASTNSENCLPRIIKPRKRRKKDRKPSHLIQPLVAEDCFSTDSVSPDIDAPQDIRIEQYLPFTFEHHLSSQVFNNNVSIKIVKSELQETPKLHHSFEDIEELSKDVNDNQPTSLCQCRYCDPSGQIWDVERNCYSPFLTTPDYQNSFNFPEIQSESLVKPYETSISSELIHCMTGLSLDENRSEHDTSISESLRDLEVSTEIVTSLNGHRDLEIKFFSSSNMDVSKNGIVRSLSLEGNRNVNNDDPGVNNQFDSVQA